MNIKVREVAIKTALVKEGDTYRSFSKKAGISLSYFSAIMNGHYNPSPKMAKKICHYLQKDFDDLFYIHEKEVKQNA